ncbi:MAG: four helix bundle protein [Bacteroidales bacterium]|nr:four helix bundle protein [Bacteroidales bacterium]MBR4218462.1 four helix bundle protein [Bacteroidales bacterium]
MAKDSVLREKSYDFAIRVIKLAKFLREEKQEYILSRQIVRCGTSIGANIEEASGAQSDNDFIAKLHISLKESKETHYWLRLLRDTEYITKTQAESLLEDINEIITIITRSLKTIKIKKESNTK